VGTRAASVASRGNGPFPLCSPVPPPDLFAPMLHWLRKQRAAALQKKGAPRRIRIHSQHPQPPDAPRPEYVRIAFEFLDPPGPWSMQFYEAVPEAAVLGELAPGASAQFYESEDGARTRLLVTEGGKPLWPR
jgi:hypothetical protein